jgi:hypothetical protein
MISSINIILSISIDVYLNLIAKYLHICIDNQSKRGSTNDFRKAFLILQI